jgi:DNA-binding transcriptional LysR family regulator
MTTLGDGCRPDVKIDPKHLSLVLAVAEYGTFGRAAEAMGVCQPALSKSIALLERRLGTPLFDRGPRGSTLTDAGRIVARRAQGLEWLVARIQDEIKASTDRLDGPIEIGATPSMMLGLVPKALSLTLDCHPRLIVNITEGLDDALTPALQRGEIDLLVGPAAALHPVPPDLIEMSLAEEALFVALPPGHRFSGAEAICLEDLRDEAWVLPAPGSSFHRVVEALFLTSGIPWPTHVIGTNRLHIHETLVLRNGRIAILTATQLLGAATSLQAVSLKGAPRRALGVKRRKGVKLPPPAEIFAEKLQAVAAALEGAKGPGARHSPREPTAIHFGRQSL